MEIIVTLATKFWQWSILIGCSNNNISNKFIR